MAKKRPKKTTKKVVEKTSTTTTVIGNPPPVPGDLYWGIFEKLEHPRGATHVTIDGRVFRTVQSKPAGIKRWHDLVGQPVVFEYQGYDTTQPSYSTLPWIAVRVVVRESDAERDYQRWTAYHTREHEEAQCEYFRERQSGRGRNPAPCDRQLFDRLLRGGAP